MRFLAILFASTFIVTAAYAEDEFGDRFANLTPAALGGDEIENMDLLAEGLQDIMPAAGDEHAVAAPETPTEDPAILQEKPAAE